MYHRYVWGGWRQVDVETWNRICWRSPGARILQEKASQWSDVCVLWNHRIGRKCWFFEFSRFSWFLIFDVFLLVFWSMLYSFCKFDEISRRAMPTCVWLFRFVAWAVTCVYLDYVYSCWLRILGSLERVWLAVCMVIAWCGGGVICAGICEGELWGGVASVFVCLRWVGYNVVCVGGHGLGCGSGVSAFVSVFLRFSLSAL